ncbi:MAG: O-antigen ligase family protein [Anditalea sp.]
MEYIQQPSGVKQITDFNWTDIKLSEVMFCLCLISIFLPIKIYPIVFLISSFIFYLDTEKLLVSKWVIFLSVFSLYAVISFFLSYNGETFMATNIIKLLVNFVFLYFAVGWLRQRDNNNLLRGVDFVLHFIFLLVFVQLVLYHKGIEFRMLWGSFSSAQTSELYKPDLFFWGLEDKNMFGARIAMLGFPYILIPLIRFNKVSWGRICWIFLLAYLSLSRTPVVALLIGVFILVWISSNARWRIILVFFISVSLPFLLEKLIRVEQFTSSRDGMGVRLVYWRAFFEHFTAISPLGNGFLSAPEFLGKYAQFYHGEPHIHNTFMTSYLELGIVGLVSYCLFLAYFYLECKSQLQDNKFWIAAFLPMLSIMMILYSGYDNDIVIYLSMVFLLGNIRFIDFKTVRMGI